MQLNLFPITLVETYMISPTVKHFIFQAEQIPVFTYIPGQFITVHFEREGKHLKRSYSIANVPIHDNRIEFAAGFVEGGAGTELLFNLKLGEIIQINGPFGRLVLKDTLPKRYVFAATSTGITPYRAMFQELSTRLQSNPLLKVVILLGVRNKAEALYQEEFLTFAAEFPKQVTFRLQFSRPNADLEFCQYAGYVQHAFSEINLNCEEDMVYLCGNPGMIDEAFANLKERGFSMQQIIREKYITAPNTRN